jgi:hypothetical protein
LEATQRDADCTGHHFVDYAEAIVQNVSFVLRESLSGRKDSILRQLEQLQNKVLNAHGKAQVTLEQTNHAIISALGA